MSSIRPQSERTDLIDVNDIDANSLEDLGEPVTDRGNLNDLAYDVPNGSDGIAPAEAMDRFAAAVIDAISLYVLYWPLMLVYRSVALDGAAGPIPVTGVHGIIFHALFLLIAFLLLIMTEVAAGATIGKLVCGLRVMSSEGFTPSVASIVVRNLLKPVDLLLAPFIVPFACFEWTTFHKRIGDILSGTVVFKAVHSHRRQHALSLEVIASASTRLFAFLLDLALASVFFLGYALLLSPEYPVPSMLLIVMLPVVLIAFFALPEWLLKTSAGKWIFGLVVCHEDGTVVSPSGALVRTIWLCFDANPFGFLTMFNSLRKQRAGDCAAQTVVIKAKREMAGLISVIATMVAATGVFYFGAQNRDSILHPGFQVNFLPSADFSGFAPPRELSSAGLAVMNFNFAEGEGDSKTPKRPAIYEPGETINIMFQVTGYTVKGQKVWIQEDLMVSYPDGTAGLKMENISEYNDKLQKPGPISFENPVALPEDASPGRYSVTITLRDKISQKDIKEQRFFYVSPKDEPSTTKESPAEDDKGTPSPAQQNEGETGGQPESFRGQEAPDGGGQADQNEEGTPPPRTKTPVPNLN